MGNKYLGWKLFSICIVAGFLAKALWFTGSSGTLRTVADNPVREQAGVIAVDERNTVFRSDTTIEVKSSPNNPFAASRSVNVKDKTAADTLLRSEFLPTGEAVEDTTVVFDTWLKNTFNSDANDNGTSVKRVVTKNSESKKENPWLSEASKTTGDAGATAMSAESVELITEQTDPLNLYITGYVVTPAGRTVAGLQISAQSANGDLAVVTTRSLSDGSFVLANLNSGDYELIVNGGEDYTSIKQLRRAGERGALLVVTQINVKTVSGVVSDEYGVPIANALVRGPGASIPVTTGADGAFEMQVSDSSGGALIRYEAAGFLKASRHIVGKEWKQSNTVDASTQMQDSGVLMVSGVVTDADNLPVANAYVEVRSRNPAFTVGKKTDEQGVFAIADVRVTQTADIEVRAGNGYDVHNTSGVVLQQDANFNVTLHPRTTATLNATLTDSHGLPLSNMAFLVSNITHSSATLYGTSDDAGVLKVSNINPGTFRLRSLVKSPVVIIDGVEAGLQTEIPIDIGPYVLKGRLLNSDGQPVHDAELTMLHQAEQLGITTKTSRSTKSGADGAFEFGGLGAGAREITVSSSDNRMSFTADPVQSTGGVVLVR